MVVNARGAAEVRGKYKTKRTLYYVTGFIVFQNNRLSHIYTIEFNGINL